MSKSGAFLKIQRVIVKNAPTILAAMGAVGTIAAVCMSSDAALRAKKAIEQAERDAKGDDYETYISGTKLLKSGKSEEDVKQELSIADNETDILKPALSKADKALIYAKAYAPTAIMTGASIFCIFGSNHINKQRIASLAGAYILKETAFEEYKAKAEEVIGKKKATEIGDEIIQSHIDQNPPTDLNTMQTNIPNAVQLSLWYDETSNRYFYSNQEYIRRAELEANRMLDKNGYVGINDVYELLGIEPIALGDDMGWQKDMNGEVTIEIGAALLGPDVPCGTIKMEVRPTSAWLSEV